MKEEKRLHFYGEGGGSFTSMKREKRLGAWLWSLAMELEAFYKESKGEELFKKNEHGKS